MAGRPRDLATFSNLLETVYDSATDPDHWEVFLRELAHAINGKSGLLRVIDEQASARRTNFHYNLDPELQELHRRHYVTCDVFVDALRDKPAGFITTTEGLVERRELETTEFFNDYLLPQDTHHICGGLAMRNAGCTIMFGVQRDARTGAFASDDADFIRLFVPHIQRAVRLGHLFDLAHHQLETAEQALESLAVGILLLDENERLLHANTRAEDLLRRECGLRIHDGRLCVMQEADEQGLRDMLAVTRNRTRHEAAPVPESMLLTPGPTDPQLLIVSCPVKRHLPHFHGPWPEVSAAVFVSNLADAGLLNHDVLMQLYGLTTTEAQLACALSRGHDLADLARDWEVSRETLRTHLKRVLHKTGTSRQADLVRLLAGHPWDLTAGRRPLHPFPGIDDD